MYNAISNRLNTPSGDTKKKTRYYPVERQRTTTKLTNPSLFFNVIEFSSNSVFSVNFVCRM